MDNGRNTWGAAIRLAMTWSVLAALVAVAATSIGGVPQTAVVLGVIVIGFALSWARTVAPAHRAVPSHRMVRVPVRRAHPVG